MVSPLKVFSFARTVSFLLSSAALFVSLTACDPMVDRPMTARQREDDFKQLDAIFRENYAPLELKEKLNGFDYDKLVSRYLRAARREQSNPEYIQLLKRFVAEFSDAHTGASITPSDVAGQASIAYAGLEGERNGENFVVTKVLFEGFPIAVGEEISHIDGIKVTDYIDRYLTPYRNLGDKKANHTMHMHNLFTRMDLSFPLPKNPEMKLTVVDPDGKAPRTVLIPWVVQDLHDFKLEAALKAAKPDAKVVVSKDSRGNPLELAVVDHRGKVIPLKNLINRLRSAPSLLDSFELTGIAAVKLRKVGETDAEPKEPRERLAAERKIPENAIFIDQAKSFPAYVYKADVNDEEGKKRGSKTIGYIRIETFSPDGDTEVIVTEVEKTLEVFRQHQVTSVIVDTIDNPGGSLVFMAKVAQAFSDKDIELPKMEVRLNDNWVREFHMAESDTALPPHVRASYLRLYKRLRAEQAAGKRMSSPISMEEILPYQLKPHKNVRFEKVIVLTNEMNASCGDIFPAIMKDNNLATLVGTKTMGAGGNVTEHMNDQLVISHLKVRQTESLVLRADGSYVENFGVKPDIELDTNAMRSGGYSALFAKIEEMLTRPKRLAEAEAAGKINVCAKLFSK